MDFETFYNIYNKQDRKEFRDNDYGIFLKVDFQGKISLNSLVIIAPLGTILISSDNSEWFWAGTCKSFFSSVLTAKDWVKHWQADLENTHTNKLAKNCLSKLAKNCL